MKNKKNDKIDEIINNIKIDKNKIKDLISQGQIEGSAIAGSMSIPLVAAFTELATSKGTKEQEEMAKEMLEDVWKKDPGLIVKKFVEDNPNIDKNSVIARIRGKMRQMINQYKKNFSFWRFGEEYMSKAPEADKIKLYEEIRNSRLMPQRNVITYAGDPHVLMHELGHALDYSGNKMFKYFLPGIAPIASGVVARQLAGTKYEDYAPHAVAAGFLPLLSSEAKASLNALKYINKSKGSSEVMKALTKYIPAFGTYLSMPIGAYLGVKYIVDKYKKDEKAKAKKYLTMGSELEKKSNFEKGFIKKIIDRAING